MKRNLKYATSKAYKQTLNQSHLKHGSLLVVYLNLEKIPGWVVKSLLFSVIESFHLSIVVYLNLSIVVYLNLEKIPGWVVKSLLFSVIESFHLSIEFNACHDKSIM